MKIKVGYDAITRELELFRGLLGQKTLQEDMRVVNIMKVGEKLQMVGVDPEIICKVDIEGEYDTTELADDWSVALSVKELQDNLNKFRGLQRTQVESVELEILDKGVILRVEEKAKDQEIENAEYYDQTTSFKISKRGISSFAKKEIAEMRVVDIDDEMTTVDTMQIRKYLEYCYPLMATHKMEENLHFKDDSVIAVIGNRYAVKMQNTLEDIFTDISMSKFVVGFLKDLMSVEETFKVAQREEAKGVYKMYIEVNGYKLRLNLRDRTEMVNKSSLDSNPTSSILVDKYYLTDVLKRFEAKEVFFLSIDLTAEVPQMVIRTTKSRHTIPLKDHSGEDKFTITMQAELLNQLMFSHIRRSLIDGVELDEVQIEFETTVLYEGAEETISVTCTDPSKAWVTKFPKATKSEAPLLDF